MNVLVDFASKNLFSTLDSKRSHLIAELIASALNLRGSFSLSGLDDAVGFNRSLSLGILNDRKRTLFAIGNDGGSTGAAAASMALPCSVATARAFSPLLAAAKPSAIFFCRSSIA